jgi:hypothetical protein
MVKAFKKNINAYNKLMNYASAFPAACGGVSEHKKNIQSIEDSSRLAARSFNKTF